MTIEELSQLYYLNCEMEMDKERLEKLDFEIQECEQRLSFLRAKSASPAAPNYTGMPKSSTWENQLEKVVAKITDTEMTIEKKRDLRSECVEIIKAKQILCLSERKKLERYIADLPNSSLRLIFTYRFVCGLPWRQVAENIGGSATEDSVKKACYRYIDHKKNRAGKNYVPNVLANKATV